MIVVNDGSADDGPAIVSRYGGTKKLVLLSKPNSGQSSARNYGIAHAHGDLIALLDQGDIWYPSHLAELTKPFRETWSRPLGWTYSNLDEIDENGNLVAQSVLARTGVEHPKTNLVDCLRRDMFILPSASLISRSAFEAVGGFDERLSRYEDDDLFIRLLQAGYDNVYVDKPLSRWRVFSESASFSPRMAASRMIFARKLVNAFPDDLEKARHYVRDLIAPRFVGQALAESKKALASMDDAWIDSSFDDLHFLERFLKIQEGTGQALRDPLITAVIPLFNGEHFIEEAIESILSQTLRPDEIIVVDDGSTDTGPEIVRRLAKTAPIRLIRQENAGQSAARNLGAKYAHGDLIAFLDQDDAWYANHLVELVVPFREPRAIELGWAYSNLDQITEEGELVSCGILDPRAASHPKRDVFTCIANDMFVLPSAALISRRALLSIGGFDESLSGYEDDDLFLRLFRAGFDNVYLRQSLSKWRIYSASSSYSPRMATSRATYARKLIARYPNDPYMSRYNVRDLIAPRFFRSMAGDLRRAVVKGDGVQTGQALAHLSFITRHLRLLHRVPIRFFLLPALHVPPVARTIMRHRDLFVAIFRRFFGGLV